MSKYKDKELAYFQTNFTVSGLIVAIAIAFSVHSMTEERLEWAIGWGIVATILFAGMMNSRNKKLKKIFDDHEIIRG